MKKALALIGAAGIGAGLMYFLDPDRGRSRRARVRDAVTHEANKALHAASSTGRDAGNRLTGLLARAGSVFEPEDLDDSLIVERVRAKMGRVASHPHLVHVASSNGEVSLSGTVPANELDELISTASKVRGVIKVQSRLEPRQSELELLHP